MIESHPYYTGPTKETGDNRPEKDSSTTKKKKLGRSVAREVVLPPAESPQPDKVQSLWQRFASLAEKKELDKAILRPVEQADNDAKLTMPSIEKTNADETDTASKRETGADVPLESLSPEEIKETAQRYIEARKETLREGLLRELPDDSPPPVESAADIAFLEFVEEQLAVDDTRPLESTLDEAADVLAARLDVEPSTAESETEIEIPEDEIRAPHEGEIVLRSDGSEIGHEEEATVVIHTDDPTHLPRPASGGSGSGGNVPPTPPIPGGNASLPLPPPGGGSGNIPPSSYGSGMSFPVGAPSAGFNMAAAPNRAAVMLYQVHVYERRALAQGLLLGGIIGYLIGRRRGRIKTEKRLLPIQKKLEKQVVDLQGAILAKEQKIQTMAHEKAYALKTLEERRRLVDRLLSAQNEPTVIIRPEEHIKAAHKKQVGRLGKVVVESPLAVAVAVPGAAQESFRKAPNNFERNVEDYSMAELKQAAEKIRIDGTTLKDLWDNDRLDERAVKRVMSEYVEGGSVRTALDKELLHEEVRFERDPKNRSRTSGASTGSGYGALTGMAAAAGAALLSRNVESGQNVRTDTQPAKQIEVPHKQKTSKPNTTQIVAASGIAAGLIALLLIIF